MKRQNPKLIFNPEYMLRHDKDKVVLATKNSDVEPIYGAEDSFISVIHPIYAMMLSLFNGKTFEDSITDIHNHFEIDKTLIRNTFTNLVDNDERKGVKFLGRTIFFPKKLIIPMSKEMDVHKYKPEMFEYTELDVRLKRLNIPLDLTFNVTSRCMTDCIYCYADRRKMIDCTIPLKRIYELIDEAKKLNLRNIDVIGGEFFLYKHWYEMLHKLKQNGFNPFLSTKIALKEPMIKKLKTLDVKSIQISLDSMIKDSLLKAVQVKEKYFYNMQESFKLLEKYSIDVQVHTILSSATDSVEDIKSLEKFLMKFKNIIDWRIDYGEYSTYLGEDAFKSYKAAPNNVNLINQYIKQMNSKELFDFRVNEVEFTENINAMSIKEKKEAFDDRALCSGNFYAMYILPNGKVTICEELYWNKHFILGDVTKQSIEEIWKSEEAKDIFYIKQENISPESPCRNCNMFDSCRSDPRQICYRDTIKAYGYEKWDFPDIRCPKAPKIEKEMFA